MKRNDTKQVDRLNTMKKEGLAEPEMLDIFHTLRRKGNTASHDASYGTTEEAKTLLALAYQISIWFMEVYIDWEFVAPTYREPEPEASSKELQLKVQALEEEIAKKRKNY